MLGLPNNLKDYFSEVLILNYTILNNCMLIDLTENPKNELFKF